MACGQLHAIAVASTMSSHLQSTDISRRYRQGRAHIYQGASGRGKLGMGLATAKPLLRLTEQPLNWYVCMYSHTYSKIMDQPGIYVWSHILQNY